MGQSVHATQPRRLSAPRSWVIGLRLWVIAALVGLAVGVAVIFMRLAILGGEFFFFNASHEQVATAARDLPWQTLLVAPVVGGSIVGMLLWLGKNSGWGNAPRSFGVAEVMAARRSPKKLTDATLSVRDGLLSAAIAVVSLSSGSSTGREGPAVHLGAMISSLPSRWLKLDIRATRTLIGCGAAAAVSASFHAPLAGLLFAREVVLQRYRIADIGPVAVSSVVAALAARAHFGEDSIFPPPDLSETPLSFFLITPLMGCLAAGLALVAIWTWIEAPKAGERLADRTGLPVWALPPLGGFAIGALALAFPQILGVGYEATASAIAGAYQPLFLLVLVLAKLAATAISLGSRFGNGVFSPSIYLGAMIGGAFGAAAGLALGDFETGRTFFTIVGMGAVSGAVLGAPISTTLIVFELTASYETAAAVLVSVSLATVLVQGVGGAIFERQLRIRMRER